MVAAHLSEALRAVLWRLACLVGTAAEMLVLVPTCVGVTECKSIVGTDTSELRRKVYMHAAQYIL